MAAEAETLFNESTNSFVLNYFGFDFLKIWRYKPHFNPSNRDDLIFAMSTCYDTAKNELDINTINYIRELFQEIKKYYALNLDLE